MSEKQIVDIYQRLAALETKMDILIGKNGWKKHIPLTCIIALAIITDKTDLIPAIAKVFGG